MLLHSPIRFYADPALSLFIACTILMTAIPLTFRSGNILLESAPPGVKIHDVKHDLESIPGVRSVHELHVWRLDQRKAIASAHLIVDEKESLKEFIRKAKTVGECLHAYGIHSATLQPEIVPLLAGDEEMGDSDDGVVEEGDMQERSAVSGTNFVGDGLGLRQRSQKCGLTCGSLCEPLMCCN
jgi:zinc transporter 1